MYCEDISYDCESDTVSASCEEGRGSYKNTSFTGATECAYDLEPVYGTLYCQTPNPQYAQKSKRSSLY